VKKFCKWLVSLKENLDTVKKGMQVGEIPSINLATLGSYGLEFLLRREGG